MPRNSISGRDRALLLVNARGIARASDFTAEGISLTIVKRMMLAGEIVRLQRGLYQKPDQVGANIAHNLAEATRRVPNGIISLLSSLRHHQLTTELPDAVWMTIPHKARTPKLDNFSMQFVRATGEAFSSGIDHTIVEGVDVPIYNVPKTLSDCFKYRRHVGEDVAIEALREALRCRRTSSAEIMFYAKIDRVADYIAPFIKAIQ